MIRRGISLLAAVTSAAVLAAASAADTPVFSSTVFFRMTYRADCTFSIAIDGGIALDSVSAPSATIPPGPYQVSIRTPLPDNTWDRSSCTEALVSFSGPGVSYVSSLGTDLGPYSATLNVTFAPSSTYTIVDGNHNSSVVITTTATGSSSSLLPPPPPSTASGTSVDTGLVGSGIVPYRGALQATVATTDKATLVAKGKPLVSVKAGRYDIVVKDDSPDAGFFVQKLHRKPEAISGVRFRGKRTVRLNLTAGTWLFFSKSPRETQFVVIR